MRNLLVFAFLMLLAPEMWADASYNCKFATGVSATSISDPTRFNVDDYSSWCFRYTDAASTTNFPTNPATGLIQPVQVTGHTALICFDPDVIATNTSAARLIVHHCPQGFVADTANPLRSCIGLGGNPTATVTTALDGTEGNPAVQNACIRVGPGAYIFEPSVACVAADICQVSVKGEGAH